MRKLPRSLVLWEWEAWELCISYIPNGMLNIKLQIHVHLPRGLGHCDPGPNYLLSV